MALTDAELTDNGLDATGVGRILLIACGALAREILHVREMNGWTHVDLTCLPAIYHNHPEKITEAVEQAVAKHRETYADIFVVYADCGTGGQLQAACERLGVQMMQGPHCYSFFEGNQVFAEQYSDEITAFYLTDFLARQFDAFVWKPLGMDRHSELRDMYFSHYTKLVYQAQTDDPALTARAQEIAERLGLNFERRFTGYGDLAGSIEAFAVQKP
ncbi:MAG: DUF1638 domain-containing protein [Paracoccaceae bacterium]